MSLLHYIQVNFFSGNWKSAYLVYMFKPYLIFPTFHLHYSMASTEILPHSWTYSRCNTFSTLISHPICFIIHPFIPFSQHILPFQFFSAYFIQRGFRKFPVYFGLTWWSTLPRVCFAELFTFEESITINSTVYHQDVGWFVENFYIFNENLCLT